MTSVCPSTVACHETLVSRDSVGLVISRVCQGERVCIFIHHALLPAYVLRINWGLQSSFFPCLFHALLLPLSTIFLLFVPWLAFVCLYPCFCSFTSCSSATFFFSGLLSFRSLDCGDIYFLTFINIYLL